ncbi:DUF885 domain-containing protein [Ichthyenterobacterium magnum]|uniref:Uncharacterized protein (DUF885 family) n=1 Tax=Ichthyenterobacterium magnum TaxID=1230530 RepID=A0A420DUQ5_9FLAO|nr:DUF885 domain-containing protein [Ichthyenterobacterium magnum]RKE98054.1 uncharacterized protein (DUF885 family) [Ichthyenterobacterium magnum]
MKKIVIIACIALGFNACKNDTKTSSDETTNAEIASNFNDILNSYYEEGLKLNPLNATSAGDNRYNDKLPDVLSDEYTAKIKAYYTDFKNKINQFDDANLSESQQMSKAVLNWDCNINLERLAFREDLTPINQMWTQQLTIGQLASGASSQPFKTVEDYNNWLKRLDGYLLWMNSAEEKMKEGILIGHVLPKSIIKKVLPQLETLTTTNLDEHLFYNPIKNFPDSFSEEDKTRLTDKYKNMVLNKIVPAYKKLHDFMSTTYLTSGRESSGISDTPNGKDYYKHQIKTYTTTDMTADEVHEIGLKEVARILSEMEKVKTQVGYKGDLISFFDYVRNNKELMPFKTPEAVIANFKNIHSKMMPQVEKLFDLKPKTPFEVRRTEAFREASASAEYNPGSIDGTRPGIFYTPVPDATKYNTFSDEALFLHEAIPGHHFQISLQQENKDLPKFRKTLWYSAYGEGWALYTESLGKELGLYTDPYQYFGMLGMEMHRAIRLVVDTGLHAKGWTREQAIEYSLKNEAESEASIISEIERYMANPGQALSYKIGQLKIRKLRAKAEKELGDKFDIAQFHNQVLETGCIPLALLENKIDNWIASLK